ncbi:HAD family phosphatase (plasmid) [Tolypothrix sp. PCC 7910]|uniref:HAD family hydrolase n=1 Tax=Tolypothrix sp. PCC 7910 TaxID=2099387 RepID=UPI001427984C|nr:HAD family phosphatase [Tolypothrix sp. PCC 7910]QIR41893.1 HAD family phosphatase [Tolypothrix sp. PCC 7910]
MEVKAIIFDKDGVLVNSEEVKATAWQQTLAPYSVKNGFSWYLLHLGPSSISLAAKAIETFNLDEVPENISREWYKNYLLIKDRVKPIKENLQVLAILASEYLIGVASSMDKATIEAEMLKFGYREYIQVCVSGEDVANNKPDPDIYLATAEILQVKPSECVAIEDSPAGICAAKGAGMFCIGFKNPLYDLDLSAADVIVKDLTQIDLVKI